MSKKIAIQGYEGSFHQMAAHTYFGNDVNILPCATFKAVMQNTQNKQCNAGIMAIENSIAGSILPNYQLLQKSSLKITGEIYLPIQQHLLANKDVSINDIREVHSHPMAIQQCIDFLNTKNWKLVETEDTALSAKLVYQHKSKHIAAIAGSLAANLFHLNILLPNIHTEKFNYTRFLILEREENMLLPTQADKASINFHTDHSRGSLAKVLSVIANGGINLSKLQSFPIPGSDFQYSFHADMEFDSTNRFFSVIEQMKPLTKSLNIYGIYKNGKHILPSKNNNHL
jgi:prephenate dehydratase